MGLAGRSRSSRNATSPERPAHRVKHYDTSAAHIVASVVRSLENLGLDMIDLLLIHRPDPLMDADETAGALEEAVRSGKVRAVGVSNHQTGALSDGTLDQAQRLRQSPMIWSPLGGGDLFRTGVQSER